MRTSWRVEGGVFVFLVLKWSGLISLVFVLLPERLVRFLLSAIKNILILRMM